MRFLPRFLKDKICKKNEKYETINIPKNNKQFHKCRNMETKKKISEPKEACLFNILQTYAFYLSMQHLPVEHTEE